MSSREMVTPQQDQPFQSSWVPGKWNHSTQIKAKFCNRSVALGKMQDSEYGKPAWHHPSLGKVKVISLNWISNKLRAHFLTGIVVFVSSFSNKMSFRCIFWYSFVREFSGCNCLYFTTWYYVIFNKPPCKASQLLFNVSLVSLDYNMLYIIIFWQSVIQICG